MNDPNLKTQKFHQEAIKNPNHIKSFINLKNPVILTQATYDTEKEQQSTTKEASCKP